MSSSATTFTWRRSRLLGAALLVIWCISGVDAHTLRLRVQPGRVLGGEAFEEQPQVEILEGDGGDVDVLFQGYATAEMISSPSGFSVLEYDNATGQGNTASLTDGKGRATFSGLFISEAGEGFVLRVVAFDTAGVGVAWIDSDPFDVAVGEPYAIALSTPLGRMDGGSTFDTPPVIAVEDKGGNVVETYTGGSVTATLVAVPGSGQLLPASEVSEDIQYGYAHFDSLSIKEAGIDYKLGFTATGLTSTFSGDTYIESSIFTVGVGPAYRLELDTDILGGAIVSGSPFEEQPRVRAYDLGDNMLSSSDSAVHVSVLVNPTSATLRPTDRVFEVMDEGVATFSGLFLDRSGWNLKLRFSLYDYDRSTGDWDETGVYFDTEFFHVGEGVPAALLLEQDVDGAWAGGRGFKKQPYLTVADAGGGTITMDSFSRVTATVTPSLMVNHDVVIDTSLDPDVYITGVYTTMDDGTYGVGEEILVTVVFSAPVYADTSGGGTVVPYLYLDGTRGVDGSSGLPAVPSLVVDAGSPSISDEITFVYTVEVGDSIASAVLEVEGISAIRDGDAPLVDLLGRAADVTLPVVGSAGSLSAASSLSIDATQPVVVAVGSSLDGGEYGVGQTIPVWVDFNFPVVVVVGVGASPPVLTVGGLKDNGGGFSSTVLAEYVEGSGTSRLLFEHTIQEGDTTEGSSLGLVVPNGANFIILPSTTLLTYIASPEILQKSSNSSLAADLALTGATGGESYGVGLGADGGSVTVDTAQPEVDVARGVQVSGSGDGTYTYGDTVFITVWFTKPVTVFADVGLFLATNQPGARAEYSSGGTGTLDVIFKYDVVEGDVVADLDVYDGNALDVGDGGYFRRSATIPTQDANIDLTDAIAAGNSLADNSAIVLDGGPPQPVSVSLATGTSDSTTYGLGEFIRLTVTFDKSVTVDGASPPVLVLDCTRAREAVFDGGGDGTTTLSFEYEVQMGDFTSNLGYRYYPNAFCLESGCPSQSNTSIREMKAGGAGIHASLTLPNSLGSRVSGVPVATAVAVDTSGSRDTTIIGVSTATPSGSYGAGQVIDITVEFSDELLLDTSSGNILPTLPLNNGGEAELVEGTGTRDWLFSYTFPEDTAAAAASAVALLDIADVPVMIDCTGGCRAANWNGKTADLSLDGFDLSYAGIELDATAPVVTDLYSSKVTSLWGGVYTVGEEIEVRVVFDRPVIVTGSPRLLLDTGGYALYDGTFEDGTEVQFLYVVDYGESSADVTWAGSLALGANGAGDDGGSEDWILRRSTNPSTPADVSLPYPAYPLAPAGETIYVNTTGRPQVTSVTSPDADGTYAPGDVITVWVTFDRHVSVVGDPVFNLNTGKGEPGRANYVQGSDSQTLVFEYEVVEGDLTDSLSCTDRHALKFGFNATFGSSGYESKLRSLVAQASTNPAVAVDKVLPFYPGEEGSLSFSSNIVLDGSTPHIREIYFAGASDATYQGEDAVQIILRFSAPVIVTGAPTLKLETGVIDREAVWIDTAQITPGVDDDDEAAVVAVNVENDDFLLLFEYVVVTGDSAGDLDYWADDENWRDARASILLPDVDNGGDDDNAVIPSTIMRLSANPSLKADLHLNPPGGHLSGTDRATAYGGWVYFRDLFVRTRGKGYKMKFEAYFADLMNADDLGGPSEGASIPSGTSSSSGSTAAKERGLALKSSTLFEVGFAVEFEVMSQDSDRSDLFGRAISLDGGLLLAGAPKKHRDVPEVQLIVSSGTASETHLEVQMIAVDAVHVTEIQQFITYADPYETVGGFWSLEYPGLGLSRNIPADATIEQVQAGLMEDFPTLGRILVVREDYTFCACDDGYIWTITFDEAEGEISSFVADASDLTGAGANATEVEVLQDSPVVGGTFTLSYVPWVAANYSTGEDDDNETSSLGSDDTDTSTEGMLTTRALPFDADTSALATALSEDLGLSTASVSVDCCDAQGGRKWTLELEADRGDWNISSLTCDASGLTGNRAGCWQLTGRDGEGPVTGEFRINFRESDWTPWLAHDVGAEDMEAALLGLQSIEECEVSRTLTGSAGQHVWAVTFLEVRKPTDFGFVLDDMGNMPAMEVDSTRIRGTDATVEVRYVFGGKMDYAPWEGKQMGSYGAGAGAAYVFSRSPAAEGYVWAQDQKILGSDTDGEDAFGHSVSIDEDNELLVVGAPYAEDYGVSEVQAISCNAATGTFTLGFRGFTTDPIPADASIYELYTAIKGPFGTTKNLHPFPEIDVTERFPDDWAASAGLCTGGNSALLEFRAPRHDFWGGSGDLELLTVDGSLLDGDITVQEVVKGTVNPSGPFSRGVQKGAAYVYRRSATSGLWYEETKLFLDDGLGTDRYGWQVIARGHEVTNDNIVVSAPGRNGEQGSVHVYTYTESEARWSLLQTVTSELWSLGQDQFGSSVSLSDETLVVGGVGYNSSAGAAYVFTVSRSGVYQADQRIEHPDEPRAGDRFGESVSLFDNFLAIGCPGREDTWLHTGKVATDWEGADVGAVYLYRRNTAEGVFSFFQKLLPSNVKPFDRFGASVSIDGDALIVGSHQEFEEGNLAYQRAVQVVTVQSDPGGSGVGNVYRLGWKEDCVDDADDVCEVRWTRRIETDASGVTLKNILEEDFGLGVGVSELVVVRSGMDESTGGYQYTVIFLEETKDVPKMLVDDSTVSGPNAYVSVESLNEVPGKLRGVTHVFARQVSGDVDSSFREQCFLYPWIKQRQDLFGTTVAVSGQFVAVGAPNRDTIHGSFEDQNLTSLNTGAVEVFNLNFLSFRFDSLSYSVLEGDTLSMDISRFSEFSTTQVFNLKSMDRNADQEFQDYIAAVYDLSVAYPDVPVFQTAADVVGAGTATARSQYYGSANNRSLWLGGMFDYRGLSDYTPIEEQLQFSAYETSVSYLLNTTDDNVVETPDESLTVSIYVPGMFPSFLGDLIAVVEIEDNGDGEGPTNTTSWGTVGAADSFTTFMDDKSYTSKMSSDDTEGMDRFGGALDSAEDAGLMIVGDEFSEIDGHVNCGSAYIFRLEYGVWHQEAQLLPGNVAADAHFGQAVQINKVYEREMYTALVGAPGQAVVYVFEYNIDTGEWDEAQTLVAAGVDLPNDGFGGKNTISLDGDLAAVGAPGAESVFLFHRTASAAAGGGGGLDWAWGQDPVETLVSSDFDYDVVHLLRIVHRQDYGAAVALDVSSRTLAIGSPLADYDKLGTDEPETYDTRPNKAGARARGKVYVYYSAPAVQSVMLGTEFGLSAGTFVLSLQHRSTAANTTQVSWDAQAADFKAAVETLSNVEEVEVTKDQWTDETGYDFYRWTVSFTSEFIDDPPLLVPSWGGGNGCPDCVEFSSGFPRDGGVRVNVTSEGTMGSWEEQAVLQASDRRSGDRFGAAVALDQETLAVGAYHSSALAETTWDFETGDLVGWRQTGDAFALQPTYGDNPYFRAGGSSSSRATGDWSRPSKSRLKGRYFVGTYEARPGAGAGDYINPSPNYRAGSHQGDGPTGTLTSEVFTIGGDEEDEVSTISLLVGGGCDERSEYVELLADGVGVARATGMCTETMRSVSWDVSALAGRAGQVRIVDASSASPWGHVNVDEIVLSWHNRGGLHPERAANVTATGAASSKAHYVAREDDTSRAGAVYLFSRLVPPEASTAFSSSSATPVCSEEDNSGSGIDGGEQPEVRRFYCPRGGERGQPYCGWEESAKLTASDRRGGDLFGRCLSVDHYSGIVVVGAPGASLTGLWREPPTVYTTTNPHGDAENALATRVPLPMDERNAKLLRLKGAYGSTAQAGSGAPLVWQLQNSEYALETSEQQFNTRGNSQAGAVYVFMRLPAESAGVGRACELGREGDIAGVWPGAEHFKLQAHDAVAADRFGSAVSYLAAKRALFVGAPYSNSFGSDGGAAYQYDVGIAGAFFTQAEFSVEEGHWRQLHEKSQYLEGWKATVLVARDSDQSDFWLTVAFATSDLTARGVDSDAYRDCFELPVSERLPEVCGDYEQTAGELTFEPGQTEKSFFVRIMDDHCQERYPEYVQLSLSIPGGGALQGQHYLAKLRIDDDDRDRNECG